MTAIDLRADSVRVSPTLAINEAVRARRAAGGDVVHLGFGEAGLPVHPSLREALVAAASDAAYGDVGGSPGLRAAVAAYYARRGLATDEWQILVGPGSKALLFALVFALDGDIVLPQPSWVSYAAQAVLARKAALRVPIPSDAGGIPAPDLLAEAIAEARVRGSAPGVLLVTQPDNPTGTFASPNALDEVLRIAREERLVVVADEIYADVVHPGHEFTSAAQLDEANCVVTGGLSKSLALGGWRIGVARVPRNDLGRALAGRVRAIGSEIWSCIPGPIDAAARLAFEEPVQLRQHVERSRLLHAQVSGAVHRALVDMAVDCRAPSAGFYLYADLERHRVRFAERAITTGAELARWLLDRHGIAVLPGEAFGDEPEALRFRLATSLLYGASEGERWNALEAAVAGAAAGLPAVAAATARLREALA